MKPLYDVHFHVQNLTHAHLEAFIDRLRKDSKVAQLLLKPIKPELLDALLLAAPLVGVFRIVKRILKGIGGNPDKPTEAHLRILNLLLLMNRPIDEYFLAVHDELGHMLTPNFGIGQQKFDHVMVSALIMDYTDRDYSSSWTKGIPYAQRSKPVVRQTEDLLAGMKRYRETLRERNEAPKLTVLPFLGLNPENYGLEPERYVMLKAKLDQGSAEHIFSTGMGRAKASYIPASGRLDWKAESFTDQDVNDLVAAIKPGQATEDVRLTQVALQDFKKKLEGKSASAVALLVNLNQNKLSAALRDKFVYEPKPQGGVLTWKGGHMSESERNELIKALEKPAESTEASRKLNAYSYSAGRIEYVFKSLEDKETTTIQKLLNQFFGAKQVTKAEVIANQEVWTGNINTVGQGLFTGIKLYPPLGFDPNPGGSTEHIHENSRKKRVWYLYKFCEDRQIPITVHTSDGGFQIMEEHLHFKFTSPEGWLGVLQSFPKLRINFAHNGVQSAIMNNGEHSWKRILFEQIICARKPNGEWAFANTYSDVSDLLNSTEAYEQWEEGMAVLKLDNAQWIHLSDRLLFGSDFMINLRESEKYSDYLSRFVINEPKSHPPKNNKFKLQLNSPELRHKMCVTNAERFLFPNG